MHFSCKALGYLGAYRYVWKDKFFKIVWKEVSVRNSNSSIWLVWIPSWFYFSSLYFIAVQSKIQYGDKLCFEFPTLFIWQLKKSSNQKHYNIKLLFIFVYNYTAPVCFFIVLKLVELNINSACHPSLSLHKKCSRKNQWYKRQKDDGTPIYQMNQRNI